MKYRYKITNRAQEFLTELGALKIVFDKLPILPHIEERLRRESILQSALFSARIEGNPLTRKQAEFLSFSANDSDFKKLEVFNLLRAYKFVYREATSSAYFGKTPNNASLKFIGRLHQLAMNKIIVNTGRLRRKPCAIFNQAGVTIYLAPSHFKLPELMGDFIKSVNSWREEMPIKAALGQFFFEKIHPFSDGNGRVGRLISAYLLKKGNFHFRGLVSFEQYIDEHREAYYQALEPNIDASEFIEFFLESLLGQANLFLEKLKNQAQETPEDTLLPRRREILEIIKDHPFCSFDFLSRRFPSVNPKTLHYDLLRLQKEGFIQKAGKTRGSRYKIKP